MRHAGCWVIAYDGEFAESEHPRAPEGAPQSRGGQFVDASSIAQSISRFEFDASKAKNLVVNPEKYKGVTKVTDPAVIAAITHPVYGRLGGVREDGTLTPSAAKNIVSILTDYNRRASRQETEKQQKAFLKKVFKDNETAIRAIHKSDLLDFTAMPDSSFNDSIHVRIYKSPTWGKGQSSEYRLVLVNGEPAFARKSNHWGFFSTNIYAGTEEAARKGITELGDEFGRVGRQPHHWAIKGGKEDSKASQAAYVLLKDVLAGKNKQAHDGKFR